jgi:hypothetical protein
MVCIGTAGDDAEVAARLLERMRIDVGLGGRLLDVADPLGAMGERVLEKLLHIAGVEDYQVALATSRAACQR